MQQPTTINVLGTLASTDVVTYSQAGYSGTNSLTFQGTPATKVAAGTIINGAAVVPIARSPGNGQLTKVTFSGAAIGNVAVGDLVFNSTTPSYAWVEALVSGNAYTLSVPYSLVSGEVTWSQTDTVTTYTLPQVTFGSIIGSTVITLIDAHAPSGGYITYGGAILKVAKQTGAVVLLGGANISEFIDCDILGGTSGQRYQAGPVFVAAGQIRSAAFNLGAGSTLLLDVFLGGSGGPTYANSVTLDSVYIDTTSALLLWGGVSTLVGPVWGPGSIENNGGLLIPVGVGAPQTSILNLDGGLGAITVGGGIQQVLAIDSSSNPAVLRGPINLTAATLDAFVDAGGCRNPGGVVACMSQSSTGAYIRSGAL